MIKIACQTIIFGNGIKQNIERILQNIAEIGYDGVEVGGRHLELDKPEYYLELLQKNNLELPIIHVGGDFLNRDSVAEQLEGIGRTVSFAGRMGCKYIYLSGAYREGKTDGDYLHEARTYMEIGRRCAAAGLTLCYHNHDWEFGCAGKGMEILLKNVPPEYMKLAPDVGWIAVAGADPATFITEHAERIEALHFKDFAHKENPRAFTELGTGIVDFPAVLGCMKGGRELWITAEQDETARRPEESAAMNLAYIRKLVQEGSA